MKEYPLEVGSVVKLMLKTVQIYLRKSDHIQGKPSLNKQLFFFLNQRNYLLSYSGIFPVALSRKYLL